MPCTFIYKGIEYTKEELISKLEDGSLKDLESVDTTTSLEEVKNSMGFLQGESIIDFIDRSNPDILTNTLNVNPDLVIELNEEDKTNYNRSKNKVSISLKEIFTNSVLLNLPLKETLNYAIEHELTHAVQVPGILQNTDVQRTLEGILNRLRTLQSTRKFIDLQKGGMEINGTPKALMDIYELASEAISNPSFKEYLKTIKSKEDNLWQRVINLFRSLLGLPTINNETIYDQIDSAINSKEFVQYVYDNLLREGEEYDYLPKNGIFSTFEFAIEKDIEQRKGEFEAIFDQLVLKLNDLNRTLSNETAYRDKKLVKSLLEDYQNVTGNIGKIETGLKIIQALWEITDKVELGIKNLDKETDNNKKLLLLQTYITETNSFRDLIPFINELSIEIKKIPNPSNFTSHFNNQLQKIANINSLANTRFVKEARPILSQLLGVKEADFAVAVKLTENIKALKDKRDNVTEQIKKDYYTAKIKKEEEKLSKLPTIENFEKLFKGEMRDVTFTDLNLVSMGLNSHFAIQRLAQLLHDKDIELSHATLNQANKVQALRDRFKNFKHTQLIKELTHKIKLADKVTEENGKLVFTYKETKAWKLDATPEYYQKFTEYQAGIDFLSAKKAEDPSYQEKFEKYFEEYVAWRKENVNEEYEDLYYKQYDILHEKLIKEDGTITTLYKERNGLFRRLEEIEIQKSMPGLTEDQLQIIEERWQALRSEQKQLLNKFDETTNKEKTGFAKKLHEQAIKYQEIKKDIVDYVIEDKDRERHKKDYENIEEVFNQELRTKQLTIEQLNLDFNAGKIKESYYNSRIKGLTKEIETLEERKLTALEKTYINTLSDEFFTTQAELKKRADELMTALINNEEIAPYVTVNPSKSTFGDMAKRVGVYRDTDHVINGNIVPDHIVTYVKDVQEQIREIRKSVNTLQNLNRLSSKDYETFQMLSKLEQRTPDETKEYVRLYNELQRRKELFAKYEEDIAEYKNVLNELYSLTEGSNTEYYEAKVNALQKEVAKEQEERIKNLEDPLSFLDSAGYTKSGNTFYNPDGKVLGDDINLAIEALAFEIAYNTMQTTDWWKQNHILTEYNGEEKWEPIYIWKEIIPVDPNHIKKEISFKYRTPQIKVNKNPEFREALKGLGSPKSRSKFRLKNTTSSELKSLQEELKNMMSETETQAGMGDFQKLYDLLPGIPKHDNELTKEFESEIFTKDYYINIKDNLIGKGSEDEQFQQEGSQTDVFFRNKNVPFRFNRALQEEKQSNDLFYMALRYFNANMNAYNMVQLQPVFEAMLLATKDLPTLKVAKSVSVKNTWKNIKKRFQQDHSETNTEINTEEANLHKNVEHLLKTYIYGQTKNDAVIGGVDWNKLASQFKGASSFMIFAGKLFSPLKNLGAGKINFLLNARQGTTIYDYQDLVYGTGKAITLIPDLLNDYRQKRFGNKSHIGQAIEFFQVLQGGVQDSFGRFTMFSALSEAKHMLTVPKHLSEIELQISGFKAISHANQLKLKDGTKVDFDDAFETKDNKFQLKDGVTKLDGSPVTQQDINNIIYKIKFINLVVNGAFRTDEKALVEKGVLGSLAYYLNGFVIPGIKNRYSNDWYSYMTDDIRRGHIREGLHFMKQLLIYKGQARFLWNELSQEEKNRVARFAGEISAATIGLILASLLGAGDTKGENREKSNFHLYMLALTMGISSEVQTFIPVPGLGMDEIVRKMNNPFAVTRQITTGYNMISHLLELTTYPFDGESGTYKKDTATDDIFHKKGMPKFLADAVKIIGWKNSEFTPIEKVSELKTAQTIR